jgi:DNA (cytosine-5)-methyltransferase 1
MQAYIPKISDTIQTTANDYSRVDGFCMLTQVVAKSLLGAKNPTAVAIRTANTGANGHGISTELAHTLDQAQGQAVAFHATRRDGGRILGDLSPTVEAHWGTGGGNVPNVAQSMQVRRLTPRECERLQGFPDDWTNVSRNGKPAPDGPRYKALGNSMAVPVMRWIGQRIQMVENVANG